MKMNWLPIAPDFGGDLRAALKSASPEDCLEKLTSLAQYRLGFLETLQLGKALDRLTLEPISSFFAGSACHPRLVDGRPSFAGHPCRWFTPKDTDRRSYRSIRSVSTGLT